MFSMPSSATPSRACCARCGPEAFAISIAPRSPRWRSAASCCLPQRCISCTRSNHGRQSAMPSTSLVSVTDFAFDSADELAKILQETVPVGLVGDPPVLGLFVRLALPEGGAVYDLSGKFGAPLDEAAELLGAARPHAARLGIAFHVGSQCLEPAAYTRAMSLAGEAIANCGVPVDIVDVGGGFPVSYPDMAPPPLADYIAAIEAGSAALPAGVRLWAEPGRALVAGGGAVVVQVQLRRGDTLYVHGSVYGNLR